MSIPLELVVQKYLETRNEIRKMEAELEEKTASLKKLQEDREAYLYKRLQELGCKNVKTDFGTIYTARKESVTVADKDVFINWIKSNDAFSYMNIAANKTAVLEMMGEERENNPPPGVNYVAIATVQIRKA